MRASICMTVFTVALALLCTPADAQAPIPGQAYQVPAGYESYPVGTLVAYGGYNYVIQGNSTMLLAQQQGQVQQGLVMTGPSYVPSQQPGMTSSSMPGYPGYNPIVGTSSSARPTTFNPFTGTWNYDTSNTEVYSSYYQGVANANPWSRRPVHQVNPDGSITTGTVWRDWQGLPHGNVTTHTPNPFGGTNSSTTRYYFSQPGGQNRPTSR